MTFIEQNTENAINLVKHDETSVTPSSSRYELGIQFQRNRIDEIDKQLSEMSHSGLDNEWFNLMEEKDIAKVKISYLEKRLGRPTSFRVVRQGNI